MSLNDDFEVISLYEMLGTGVEPAPAINGGDFKSPVSTIPPSEQNRKLTKNRSKIQALFIFATSSRIVRPYPHSFIY